MQEVDIPGIVSSSEDSWVYSTYSFVGGSTFPSVYTEMHLLAR